MAIKGFQGTSLLDYPGKISSLLFWGGCNLRCPYCHNPGLVLDPDQYPDYPLDRILGELEQRRNFIDGVVVSGGEPTLDAGLVPALREIKKLGFDVKIDTNGLLPDILETLFADELVDYVSLDLKTAPHRYGELHHRPVSEESLLRSIRLILGAGLGYEFRTTCVPGLVEAEDILVLGEFVRGCRLWVLQQFVPPHALDDAYRGLEAHPVEKLRELASLAENFAERVVLRGV